VDTSPEKNWQFEKRRNREMDFVEDDTEKKAPEVTKDTNTSTAEEGETPISTEYPTDQQVNRQGLDDLNNGLSDDEIIAKLKALPDLQLALWGSDEMTPPRYALIHHAASRGREQLLGFILDNRPKEELVNLENNNSYTALRYAHRNNLPNITQILVDHGAVEELPPITLICSCGNEFTFESSEQSRFIANGFQQPKRCRTCRQDRKNNAHGGRGGGKGRGGRGYGRRGGGERSERR
jgi:hypothetical protein